ncbi:riboflavin synthase [Sphingobium sp. B2D3A]|uniref:riboflavin synthase n=1 Tax=unclassified Sphingobium TaxID=2611147 RepID=UPI0022241BD8|nr:MULTISPECIES: riboflavin synthase [unclassified Sphingobium]MCW2336469.1 riboflavin synthase [Sphingobium sp. B2D3A]MCW2364632.1 riboflavin synthase [Sphingobium sp. B7D2B]MCW2386223.1 riboflavin synthase [Sphingobium sp. B2D3D]MCW2392293.1 riboflavin synthase [Sphingobium sp. B11D3A]MCW2410534.1 riboflavin synthase [Sphingobium sp. B8D3D]
MFTGIITDIGTIQSAQQRGDLRLVIGCHYDMEGVDIGASIACSGVCLTVVDKGADWFAVDLSAETVSRTAQGAWAEGRLLNLERALKLGDELGGHIVTGHVDGIGEVADITAEGDSHRVTVRLPADLAPYVAAKGSITVDGVSLTVNSVEDGPEGSTFGLNIIPHTWSVTTFGQLAPGQPVNLEIDVLARYLARMKDHQARS